VSNLITSPHNPRLVRVRALLEKRKQREAEQAFVVEGVRLAEEALAAGWQPELVLYSEQLSERGRAVAQGFAQLGAEAWELSPRLMDSLADTESPQGLLAVFPARRLPLPEPLDFVLICDNLRDPGNLGTLLRSAAAAGAQAALLSPGTTDAFAPKVLRAGMGAHFRLPVYALAWAEIRALCKEGNSPMRIFLAEAAEGAACWDLDLRAPLALMVGSEAEGATPEALALADQPITIPMPGKSESLNAAVAASVLLFEVVRQRR
jgi:RNA methyltransferase, TrmH family